MADVADGERCAPVNRRIGARHRQKNLAPESAIPEYHRTIRKLLMLPTTSVAALYVYAPFVGLDFDTQQPNISIIANGIRIAYGEAIESGKHI